MLLAVALIAELACGGYPQHRRFEQPNLPAGAPAAAVSETLTWSFAPASGDGMGTACSCSVITTADGGTVVVTRSGSVGTCTPGSLLNGGAVGTLTNCSADTARVMPGGDGGSGVLGVLVEPQRSNILQYSEQFDNAAWTLEHVVAALPTVTANAATDPKGGSTADRIQLPATAAGEDSAIRQDTSASGAHYGQSVYAKTHSGGTCTLDFATYNGGTWDCDSITIDGTWRRWLREDLNVSTYWLLGNAGFRCGIARSACDLDVWGGQLEQGATGGLNSVTSYIGPTTSASVTRNADKLNFGVTTVQGLVDISAVVETSTSLATSATPFSMEFAASDSKVSALATAGSALQAIFRLAGSNTTKTSVATISKPAATTVRVFRDDTSYGSCVNGTCVTTTGQLILEYGDAGVYVGSDSTGNQVGGVVKQLVVTVSPAARTGWVGDSISTVTYGDAPGRYGTGRGRYVDNWAVGGATVTTDIQGQWNSHATSHHTVMVFEGGVNDIRADVTGAALASTVQAFLSSVESSGRHVVFNNIGPWHNGPSWTSGRQTETVAYNAAMATWCSAHPTVTCVDLYTALGNAGGGDATALLPAYDSGDHLHPSNTGAQAIADAVAAAYP